ncbi:RagB/SusD family nutrient uptake outer membrane protein [Thalassobellus citreus]|uniref:RagB/SusD family nutrient uptake outer membrane protein n=1 Tax=Thalassobellus citreus TaxID=3367752 RepID=UPI0037904777
MKKQYIIILFLVTTLFSSCDDYLDVEPKDMVTVDKTLTTADGYTSAITGVYQILQDVYNPDSFLMGNGTDVLANTYAEPYDDFSYMLTKIHHYEFDNTQVETQISAAFLNLYKAIANINIIIENIENETALTIDEVNFIEGEAKALRAFIHFDLWRLFGTVPDDTATASEVILPYALNVTNGPIDYVNYETYFSYILADLEDAKNALSVSDPIVKYTKEALNNLGSIDEYPNLGWYGRQNRFNYYATLGTLARVELWMGNNQKAYEYAKEVVDAKNEDASLKFELGTSANLGNGDYALFTEQLFGIETLDYDDIPYAATSYYAHCVNGQYIIQQFYTSASDIRLSLFETTENSALSWDAQCTKKYSKMTENDVSEYKSIPVIRLSEMYLILIESAPTLAEAQEYYDTFINTRFDIGTTLTEANRQETVLNQYIKELWAEGQIFYAYKRLNLEMLPISFQEMNADKYRVKLPEGETNSGI